MFALQLGGFGSLLSLLLFVVWVVVILAILDIRRATRRTAAATERIADRLDAVDGGGDESTVDAVVDDDSDD